MSGDLEFVPISLVCNYVFCPRRAWLEIQGECVDSDQIQAGVSGHARVDSAASRGSGEASSVEVRSERLGIIGKTDVVRVDGSGVRIREYKSTPVRRKAVVNDQTLVQLALQKACLEEMGSDVCGVEVYFLNHNQVVPVSLSGEDIGRAFKAVEETRALMLSGVAPGPFEDDARCPYCSHINVCLPDEKHSCLQPKI